MSFISDNNDGDKRQSFTFETEGETPQRPPYDAPQYSEPLRRRRRHPVLVFVLSIVLAFALGGAGMYFAYQYGVVDSAERFLQSAGILPGYGGKASAAEPSPQTPDSSSPDDDIIKNIPQEGEASASPSAKPEKKPFEPVENAPKLVLADKREREPIAVADIAELMKPSTVAVIAHASANEKDGYALGSGTVFTSDGYIITNTHVVEKAYSIEVVLDNDERVAAELVACDSTADIALLKVYRSDLTPAAFGSSEDLRVGDTVVAIGCPASLELRGTTTVGIISAQRRELTMDNAGNTMSLIQTDASINPGNSGGPLINEYGQVVGINTAKLSAFTYEGIGFAIPSDDLVGIIAELFEYGYVRGYPAIGITAAGVAAGQYGNNPAGVYVSTVDSNCDAYGKVFFGDVITEVNGEAVASVADINKIKNQLEVGDVLTLKVWHEGKFSELEIALVDKGELAD